MRNLPACDYLHVTRQLRVAFYSARYHECLRSFFHDRTGQSCFLFGLSDFIKAIRSWRDVSTIEQFGGASTRLIWFSSRIVSFARTTTEHSASGNWPLVVFFKSSVRNRVLVPQLSSPREFESEAAWRQRSVAHPRNWELVSVSTPPSSKSPRQDRARFGIIFLCAGVLPHSDRQSVSRMPKSRNGTGSRHKRKHHKSYGFLQRRQLRVSGGVPRGRESSKPCSCYVFELIASCPSARPRNRIMSCTVTLGASLCPRFKGVLHECSRIVFLDRLQRWCFHEAFWHQGM